MPRYHLIPVPQPAATHQSAAGFFRIIELADDAVIMGGELPTEYPDLAAFISAAGLAPYVRPSMRLQPKPDTPFRVSKLALVRSLRAAGFEPMFQDMLAANPEFSADWSAATVLMSDDPILQSAAIAFAAQAGISVSQVTAMLAACRG